MTYRVEFESKDNYRLAKKYFGDPPCKTCIVGPTCFSFGEENQGELPTVRLRNPCKEARIWLKYAEAFDHSILMLSENGKIRENIRPDNIKQVLRDGVKAFGLDPYKFFFE